MDGFAPNSTEKFVFYPFSPILKQQDGEVTTFSEKLWCGLLDYATAYADGRLIFTFKNGSTFKD